MTSSGIGNDDEKDERYENRFSAINGAKLVAIARLFEGPTAPPPIALDIVDAVDAGVGSDSNVCNGSNERPKNALASSCPRACDVNDAFVESAYTDDCGARSRNIADGLSFVSL